MSCKMENKRKPNFQGLFKISQGNKIAETKMHHENSEQN